MNDRILSALVSEQGLPERWWWLSFCDAHRPKGEQFLGACLVRARGFATAVRAAHQLGCNPGGEVQGTEVPDGFTIPDGDWTNRLLTRKECEEFDRAFGGSHG